MTKRVRADMDKEVGRQIMLRSAGKVDAIPEYNMIELNGTIHTLWDGMPLGAQTDDTRLLQDQELGDFSMTVLGKPQLVVVSSHTQPVVACELWFVSTDCACGYRGATG